eukprot:3941377-Rhodomonas_salina.1
MLLEGRSRETFGIGVGNVPRPSHFSQPDDPIPDQVQHVVAPSVDEPAVLAMGGVFGHVDAALVVLPHLCGSVLRLAEADEERADVYHFLSTHARGDILGFSRAEGHAVLPL